MQNYELIPEDSPELTGEITVRFSISPDGDVINAEVSCSEGLEAVEEAVPEELEELSLPAASDQTEAVPVSIPLTLVPGD